jgi:hypothetical protein
MKWGLSIVHKHEFQSCWLNELACIRNESIVEKYQLDQTFLLIGSLLDSLDYHAISFD